MNIRYLIIIALIFFANNVFGQCDCTNHKAGKESSYLIFTGRVEKIEWERIKPYGVYEITFSNYTILKKDPVKIKEVNKAIFHRKIIVYTKMDSCDCSTEGPCGFNFQKNKTYVVYVSSIYADCLTEVIDCSFTKEISDSENIAIQDDLKKK
jgi:hypothetical protein